MYRPEYAVVEGEENHQGYATDQTRQRVRSGRTAGPKPDHRGAGKGDLRQIKEPDDTVFEPVKDHDREQSPPDEKDTE